MRQPSEQPKNPGGAPKKEETKVVLSIRVFERNREAVREFARYLDEKK